MPNVLAIEDDQAIREALVDQLSGSGFHVQAARSGLDGMELLTAGDFDVVLLDLGLPDIDGTDVLRMIRGLGDTPVIVATARDDEAEMVKLLEAGADDYVVKPFSVAQIEARIRAVLRRTGEPEHAPVITVGELVVDRDAHEAMLEGEPLDLRAREFDLLAYLAARPGVMVSKRELMAEV